MGVTAAVAGFRRRADHGSPEVGQTDDELVAGVRDGDDAAFERIYDRYARGMLAFCVHMLGSREAAEDALQLTFVSAYRALRTSDNDILLRPWLYTIARNRCLSELRTRHDAVYIEEVAEDRLFVEDLADQVQRREELREMLRDVQRLPPDQRAALVLFELGDQSQKEIAMVLDVRTEKVKALIFQAREALARGREARSRPCTEIRERLATVRGAVLPRSETRAHIDRCPSCASFESEVRGQRVALALILPVSLTGELKALVLGSALHGAALGAGAGASGGGAVAATAGACGSGGGGAVAATAGACGSGGGGAVAAVGGAYGSGTVVAGGVTAVGGVGGASASLSAAASLTGASAVSAAAVSGAPVVAASTGFLAVAESAGAAGVGGLGATGVVAKVLVAAAVATGAVGASQAGNQASPPMRRPAIALQSLPASASPATNPTGPTTASTAAPSPSPVSSTAPSTPAPSTTSTTGTTTPAVSPSGPTSATSSALSPSTVVATTTSTASSTDTTATTTSTASSTDTAATTTPSSGPTDTVTTTTTTPPAPGLIPGHLVSDAQAVAQDLTKLQSDTGTVAPEYYNADLLAEQNDVLRTQTAMRTVLNGTGGWNSQPLCSDAGTVQLDVAAVNGDFGAIQAAQAASIPAMQTVSSDVTQLQMDDQVLASDRTRNPTAVPASAPSEADIQGAVTAAEDAIERSATSGSQRDEGRSSDAINGRGVSGADRRRVHSAGRWQLMLAHPRRGDKR